MHNHMEWWLQDLELGTEMEQSGVGIPDYWLLPNPLEKKLFPAPKNDMLIEAEKSTL